MTFYSSICRAGGALSALALIGSVASADTITLRIGAGHPSGPTIYVHDIATFFVPEVKRRVAAETDHEINFVEGYGGSIAGAFETLEAVQNGILDIGAYCFCFEPSKMFLHNFPYFAPFGPQDSNLAIKAARAVYDKDPWLTQSFEKNYGQKLLGLHGWDNYHLGTTKPWATVADLKGVKIAGAGPNLPWLKFVGAVPVQTVLPEAYLSLQTGVYDGIILFPSAYRGFKLFEPSPNFTLIGFGSMAVIGLTMNTNSFNRMPADVQKILLEVGREYESRAGTTLNAGQEAGIAGLKDVGANVRVIDPKVRAEWAKSLASFPSEQAKDADSRGMPGTQVMQDYLDAVSATGYKWPFAYSLK